MLSWINIGVGTVNLEYQAEPGIIREVGGPWETHNLLLVSGGEMFIFTGILDWGENQN